MLSRRGFLLGSGAATLLAACGDDGESAGTANTSTTSATGTTDPGIVLGEAFDRNGLLVAGIVQRAPYVLFESSGGLVRLADAPAEITFTFTPEGGAALAPVTTPRRGDDVDRPYYPVAVTFPSAETYAVMADVGGTVLESSVGVNADVAVPQVGDRLPVAATPTAALPGGVTTLCTRDPACPFHEISLDAAVAEARPVAVLLSTPEYCQVGICGPVLDLLIDAAPGHPDLAAIHVEVYTEGTGSDPGPVSPLVTTTFGLQYEPALFVADATGTITARLDNIYDGPELADALAR